MEMPARRSNYTLLSQFSDDQYTAGALAPYYDSVYSDTKSGKVKSEQRFDWDSSGGDLRHARIGNSFSIGLQRESNGNNFSEGSLSGEYYVSTLSTAVGNDIDSSFRYWHDDVYGIGVSSELRVKMVEGAGDSSWGRSWAQQMEESYQLQLALALRLSSEATCADDLNLLDPDPIESALRSSSSFSSPEAISH